MAKSNFLESANGIQKGAKELLERLALTQSAVGELLVSVRHSESELLEKEEQARKTREERERMERLREMLDSDQDLAAHAGGRDEEEPVKAKPTPAAEEREPKPAPESPVQAEPAPADAPATEPPPLPAA